jgi:hypothetical protein
MVFSQALCGLSQWLPEPLIKILYIAERGKGKDINFGLGQIDKSDWS